MGEWDNGTGCVPCTELHCPVPGGQAKDVSGPASLQAADHNLRSLLSHCLPSVSGHAWVCCDSPSRAGHDCEEGCGSPEVSLKVAKHMLH